MFIFYIVFNVAFFRVGGHCALFKYDQHSMIINDFAIASATTFCGYFDSFVEFLFCMLISSKFKLCQAYTSSKLLQNRGTF